MDRSFVVEWSTKGLWIRSNNLRVAGSSRGLVWFILSEACSFREFGHGESSVVEWSTRGRGSFRVEWSLKGHRGCALFPAGEGDFVLRPGDGGVVPFEPGDSKDDLVPTNVGYVKGQELMVVASQDREFRSGVCDKARGDWSSVHNFQGNGLILGNGRDSGGFKETRVDEARGCSTIH
jgi:hypothetical protein